jgi:hypothetical protein
MMDYTEVHRDISAGVAHQTLPDLAAGVLAGIAAGDGGLCAVRHPLGFVCFPVLRDGDTGICIHTWSAETAPPAPPPFSVHAHSWDLLSYVLYGAVHNQLVSLRHRPATPTHQVFEIRTGGLFDDIQATPALVSWTGAGTQTVPAGSSYAIAAGEFHTLDIPLDYHAATVVLGRSRPDVADRLLGEIGAPDHRTYRHPCSPTETARLASATLRRLADTLATTLDHP